MDTEEKAGGPALVVGRTYTGIGGAYRCMQILSANDADAAILERMADHLVFVAHHPRFRDNGELTWTRCSCARWLRTEL